ncbi:hypothetical protein [Ruegeria sp. Ofav3-42]|uniref:hypothetical protein n=1 Tax=Ruegeria sp. Ofav3-42 TaxID=2917759 RepID=UPI001EF58246|nr:hypothetical protein [Ruegeria sp. Ofav3-42]MCG7521706.1 hypothetical protein [Ruegeria sp. Ofav3-42]
MKCKQISDLEKVTEAAFQREYQSLCPVLDAEARVQHQLACLDAQVQQSRQEIDLAEGYRVTGTDVLWNGWESAARRQLNVQLARLRAQKLAALEDLRIAFGRKQAVASLVEKSKAARRPGIGNGPKI